MIEVLKILANKVNGSASVVITTMILIYMLGTASAVVNSFGLCLGIITGLCLVYLALQIFISKSEGKKE